MFSFCVLELSRYLFLDLCAFLTWYSGYNVGLGTCSCCHRSSTTSFTDLLYSPPTHWMNPPPPRQGGMEQFNRKILRLHNCVKRGVARVKPERDGRCTIVSGPCANPSRGKDITVSVCLQEKQKNSFLKLKDRNRQSSRPIQRGIAAPEGAIAPEKNGEFQTSLGTQIWILLYFDFRVYHKCNEFYVK